MLAPGARHPTDQTLRARGLGRLDERSAAAVDSHLRSCGECRRRIADLTDTDASGQGHRDRVRPDSPPPVGSSFAGPSSLEGGPASPVPPAAETLPPGLAENPDYEVLGELGRGGMGVVYLARNRLMGRKEVLKVISGNLMDRSIVRERFLREIRNAAQLHHPNIVTAYSAVRAGDRIVLAMEHVEGDDLAKLVKRQGPLPVAHAANFAYQAALGLQHAHERGMVHRDIKPSNLMLARQGKRATVKILDFGLAKATQEAPVEGGLTREGQMLGTPDYVAPEQSLDAQKADIRADIYSLGCTLYYLLTGGPPFEANSLYEILQAHHSRDAQPLNLARPEVPAELAALVAKMMAKDPAHRFQTPGEVARALKPFFKPGEAIAGSGERAVPTAGHTVAQGSAGAPPRTGARRTPAPAAEPARTAGKTKPGLAPDLIDLGQEDGLSETRPATHAPASGHLRWLWPCVAAGSLSLCALLAWKLVADAGQRPDVTPTEPSIASKPTINQGGVAKPAIEAPPRPRNVREDEGLTRSTLPKKAPSVEAVPPTPIVRGPEASAVAPGGDKPKPPLGPVSEGAAVPAPPKVKDVASKPPLDLRRIRVAAGFSRLANPKARRPSDAFWPQLAPDDFKAWRVGDPDLIEMDEEGVYVSAGPNGNLLLTKNAADRRCTLTIDVSVTKGTEAYLALRAHEGPDGWRAITSRLIEEGGKVRAGGQSADFQLPERGKPLTDLVPARRFHIVFQIDGANVCRLTVKQKGTSSTSYANLPAGEYAGAVGVFVKSGSLIIHHMDVK
jgi:hypothetical protein